MRFFVESCAVKDGEYMVSEVREDKKVNRVRDFARGYECVLRLTKEEMDSLPFLHADPWMVVFDVPYPVGKEVDL